MASMDVKVTLIGKDYVEPVSNITVDEFGSITQLFSRLNETMKLVTQLRPEAHGVIFDIKGFKINKALQTVKDEQELMEEAKGQGQGYPDGY